MPKFTHSLVEQMSRSINENDTEDLNLSLSVVSKPQLLMQSDRGGQILSVFNSTEISNDVNVRSSLNI